MASVSEQLLSSLSWGSWKQASDLHRRILFTLWIFIIYRLGTYIPLPGIDPVAMKIMASDYTSQGVLKMFNLVSGGALERMSIFALNLGPYISSSIIVQLMTALFPYFMALKKEGEAGKRKLNQYTRYGTIGLSVFQAAGLASLLSMRPGLVLDPGFFFYGSTVVTIVGSTLFLMWLGEQITARGLGNGSSMLIYAGIVSTLPRSIVQTLELGRAGGSQFFEAFLGVVAAGVVIMFVVFMEKAYRKVMIQYPRRQVGRQVFSAEKTYMPIKMNSTGILAPIFAMALMQMFFTLTNINFIQAIPILGPSLRFLFVESYMFSLLTRVMLIIFFSFFYTSVVFNPEETAENLRKSGAFIAGYRPGITTANYFTALLNRLTVVGSVYIAFVVVFPDVMRMAGFNFPATGTALLIVASVTIEVVSQVYSYVISHQYGNLWKKRSGQK